MASATGAAGSSRRRAKSGFPPMRLSTIRAGRMRSPPRPNRSWQNPPEETLLFLGQPILRNRSAVRGGLGTLREFASRMGARPGHLRFRPQSYRLGYEHARSTKTAWDVFNERKGVCRDYAHLAVAFCRCMNFPARYCTGYLGDIGVPPSQDPMDFSAWFDVYLGGRWYTLMPVTTSHGLAEC